MSRELSTFNCLCNIESLNKSFTHQFSFWTNSISSQADVDWTEQFRILNEITDLITPQLSLREIIAHIYQNVNQLLDAYQFCVGIYVFIF